MKRAYQKKLRIHLEQRLRGISPEGVGEVPRAGWIRSVREALGMSGVQLARRLGVTAPSVSDMEKRETSGAITLTALRKAADALQCDVVYALVPRKPFEVLLSDRAREVAKANLDRVSHTMALEQQANAEEFRMRLLEEETSRLMNEAVNELWSEPS